MGLSFTVNRIELKRMLTVLGISERSIDEFIVELNRMHKHANVVVFVNMIQKLGLKNDGVTNVLRRIGIDDVVISNIFNVMDEEKIKSTYGRIVELVFE
jgi:hypothetical protein